MRAVDNWLDRFAAKHPRLGIPRLMLYIVIGNIVVFFFNTFSMGTFSAMLDFSRPLILQGQVWRLFTFIFVPMYTDPRDVLFLALSLYFYYFIGSVLEQEWGSTKFTLFYFMGVLFNIAAGFVVGVTTMHYVNLSLIFAFATLYPDMRFLLFFIIPVKIKWLAWLDAAWFVVDILQFSLVGLYPLILLPAVAFLNYFLFFWSDIKAVLTRGKGKVAHKTSRQTIDFKAAQKKAQETKGYMHKCDVCGKTDADDPTMEFRYCSKCDGYYCYCMDHINTHVHVKED